MEAVPFAKLRFELLALDCSPGLRFTLWLLTRHSNTYQVTMRHRAPRARERTT